MELDETSLNSHDPPSHSIGEPRQQGCRDLHDMFSDILVTRILVITQ